MATNKPIQRAIRILIQNCASGESVAGVFYANDFLDGASTHQLEGHLTNSRGESHRIGMRLSGVQFVAVETRGAPRKVARDVALFLAYEWFRGVAERDVMVRGGRTAASTARDAVINLWATKGYKGVSEETHFRKRFRAGASTLQGLSLLHYVCAGIGHDGVMLAGHQSVFDLRPFEYMGISGHCWYWRYGMECAVWGSVTAGAPLTKT